MRAVCAAEVSVGGVSVSFLRYGAGGGAVGGGGGGGRRRVMMVEGGCLRPGCGRVAVTRGLCMADYNVARRLVEKRQVTWAVLEAAGRCGRSRGRARAVTGAQAWFLGPVPAAVVPGLDREEES